MKIAINGFGRLGRCIARAALQRDDVEIVGINDIANHENLAYLFQKDSMHGALGKKARIENECLVLESLQDDALVDSGAPAKSSKSVESNALADSGANLDSANIKLESSVPMDSTAPRQPAQSAQNTQSTRQERATQTARISIPFFSHSDPTKLDFKALGADVVIESSGIFLQSAQVAHHIQKGVPRVIISAPATDDTPTFVLGVNHRAYAGERIISNASCTTNCLAPIAMILEREFGIREATLSTIHSYTNDQSLLDVPHRSDKRRSRAAGINIIPTTTGAAKSLYKVIPSLKGKIHGHSLRVPVADVSMVDLNAFLQKSVDARTLNELFEAESKGALKGILGIDDEYGVSSDFLNDARSSIIARDLTFCLQNMCKVMSWYDNEWGYSNRILDMAKVIL